MNGLSLRIPPWVADDDRTGGDKGWGRRQTQTSWQVSLQAKNWETEV